MHGARRAGRAAAALALLPRAAVCDQCAAHASTGVSNGDDCERFSTQPTAELCRQRLESMPNCCLGEWDSGNQRCYLKYGGTLRGSNPAVTAFNCSRPCHAPPPPTPAPPPTPRPPLPPKPACSLNGVADTDGACKCDPGWRGADCGQLDFKPAPPPEKQVAGLPNTTQPSTWGASVLKIGGTWHMWHTEIANGCPLGNYGTASQIVHATAPSPLGPWARRDVALAAFAHNPQVVRNPATGELLMFHIGADLPAHCVPRCPDRTPNNTVPAGCPSLSHGSSVANASSPDGPWQRFPYALGGDTNPAPVFVNGTLYVTVREANSAWKFFTSDGNAAAGPWKSEARPVLNPQHGVWDEDPFVFVDPRGGWHILGHRSSPGHGAGGHYYSADGHNWYMGDLAYDCNVTWAGGYTGGIIARQRPWIATDGSAKYLYNGAALPCTDCPWCKWGCQYKHSFTMVQQIA